ncbi:FAD-dependent oxidoreductase [bacterium]|nr:FAD-dependent oxidoreductase [bacterium]
MDDDAYDVVVIGGGPAGLSCALYTARAKLHTLVLDRAPGAGALASTAKIENYPGVKGPVPGSELLDTIRDQAMHFGANYSKSAVMAVDLISETKTFYTPAGTYHGRTAVIATGSLGRHEKILGEENFIGRGVSYCVTCDAAFFKDKVAAVVGHNDVVLEEALFLARFAKIVHLITPMSRLKGTSELLEEIMSTPNVVTHVGLSVKQIVGEQTVAGIIVNDKTGIESTLSLEGIFMLLSGSAPITDFLGGSLKLQSEGCIEVDCNYATSLPGVYAVGDVTCLHPKQAIIAAGEGVVAALAVDKFLSSRERTRVDYI